jgi:hypothetical protein
VKLFFENNRKINSRESVTEKDVADMIEQLHSINFPYLILEGINGNYIQCMAGDKGFVVEIRLYSEKDIFKHYVIGNKNVSKTWYTINGGVGPIQVLGHEVLQIADVKSLFASFFLKNEIEQVYSKRDITKMFGITNL